MVDEYQDVSNDEYTICRQLSSYHKNLFIVGDPDQTIYSFRGANIMNILEFDKIFIGTKTIMMNTNYRSTQSILKASNSLISKNKNRIDKQLTTPNEEGNIVIYNHSSNSLDEATWISKQIELLSEQKVPFSSIAIMYRAHYVSRLIEESLLKKNIPYTIYSGVPFYGRKEIKDILSYLRMLSLGDDISFLRTVNAPKRGIGKTRIQILTEYQKSHGGTLYEALIQNMTHPLFCNSDAMQYIKLIEEGKQKIPELTISDLLHFLLENSGYENELRLNGDDERLNNLAELKQSIEEYENNLGEKAILDQYLAEISLLTTVDKEEKTPKVSLMTIHSAKGLEFPYVFVCALSEGIFPSSRIKTAEEMEEERRLAYVAFTRARFGLFLSDADGFNYDQSIRYPSRFIFNIDNVFVRYNTAIDPMIIETAQKYIKEMEERMIPSKPHGERLTIGQKITHKVFGSGTVISINESESSYEIQYDKFTTPRHLTFSSVDLFLTKTE